MSSAICGLSDVSTPFCNTRRLTRHANASFITDKIVDILLDQEGLEVDPLDRLERDTPLHKAVRHINSCPSSEWHEPEKIALVEYLTEAGADPRIRNKGKLKPVELVDPRNTELRALLQRAEFSLMAMAGADVVDSKAEEEEGPTGSGSDDE